jgi:adenosylcobyric acid synthase
VHTSAARDGGAGRPLLVADDGEPDGCIAGAVMGTSWHGVLEHDDLRRALLTRVAHSRGRRFVPGSAPFAAARAGRLDALGDLAAHHLDLNRLSELIEHGAPAGLPTIKTEVRPCCVS